MTNNVDFGGGSRKEEIKPEITPVEQRFSKIDLQEMQSLLQDGYKIETYGEFGADGKYHFVLAKDGDEKKFELERPLGLALYTGGEPQEKQLMEYLTGLLVKLEENNKED